MKLKKEEEERGSAGKRQTNEMCTNFPTRRLQSLSPSAPLVISRKAHCKFEYVRQFETKETLLPNTWAVVRVDGRGFHAFANKHEFTKPNDVRALNLMNAAAKVVLGAFTDIVLGYGQSDEYSFVFRKSANLFSRRSAKIVTSVASLFASNYVYLWPEYFPDTKLKFAPSFDGRCVCYPSDQNIRDYLSWRQADCHINNLYNTVFWALVQQGGMTNKEAQERLKGTLSADKNEILYSQFQINYNNESQQFRKGSLLLKKKVSVPVEVHEGNNASSDSKNEDPSKHQKSGCRDRVKIFDLNVDIIGDEFWENNEYIYSF
uniref:tRNA(His) guanylyltransferase n=1 Tax=Lepeophtheirus salmonis TaxID=72036 RepID=C1BTC6_LEPSM|nr:Probable tRNAHis guanylyltransferase [Lepeophtheirus salmonis]